MFISKHKHEKLLQEAVMKAEDKAREEFYHREEHMSIGNKLEELRVRVTELEQKLESTEGCSCNCNEKTARIG